MYIYTWLRFQDFVYNNPCLRFHAFVHIYTCMCFQGLGFFPNKALLSLGSRYIKYTVVMIIPPKFDVFKALVTFTHACDIKPAFLRCTITHEWVFKPSCSFTHAFSSLVDISQLNVIGRAWYQIRL